MREVLEVQAAKRFADVPPRWHQELMEVLVKGEPAVLVGLITSL
jgi:hypothetical protein